MAAIAAVWGDVEPETIRRVAETFAGVEHRAEFVRELRGVKYYNDSIATSPTRVISGMLSLFPQKILLIAGGYDKHIPFEPLGPAVCDKVKTLILLGNTAQKIPGRGTGRAPVSRGLPGNPPGGQYGAGGGRSGGPRPAGGHCFPVPGLRRL